MLFLLVYLFVVFYYYFLYLVHSYLKIFMKRQLLYQNIILSKIYYYSYKQKQKKQLKVIILNPIIILQKVLLDYKF